MGYANDMADWAAEHRGSDSDFDAAESYNESMIQGRTVRIRRGRFNSPPPYRRLRSRSPRHQPAMRRLPPAPPSRCSEASSCRSGVSTASFMSASTSGGRCYLKGTLLKDMGGRFVRVEYLRQFDAISACDGRAARIRSIAERAGPHDVVTITAGGMSLSVTSCHRIVVLRGGSREPAPARILRVGDEVAIGQFSEAITHKPHVSVTNEPVFDIIFEPDVPVEAWNALPEHGIINRGSRPPRPRRSRARASVDHDDLDSMPCTEDSFY
mmetsp:Transcript_98308/g.246365  ORF Transcript_98308/g.246365 Transcript_98308/m.246365 type:complete len:268 (-) Transcript_98308:144-947(-)